jgi:hypothetical protein
MLILLFDINNGVVYEIKWIIFNDPHLKQYCLTISESKWLNEQKTQNLPMIVKAIIASFRMKY